MLLLDLLHPAFPIERQIAVDAPPVMLVNVSTLDKADEQIFLQAWQDNALFMKLNPGFRKAFSHSEYRAELSAYPSSGVASPHLSGKEALVIASLAARSASRLRQLRAVVSSDR